MALHWGQSRARDDDPERTTLAQQLGSDSSERALSSGKVFSQGKLPLMFHNRFAFHKVVRIFLICRVME